MLNVSRTFYLSLFTLVFLISVDSFSATLTARQSTPVTFECSLINKETQKPILEWIELSSEPTRNIVITPLAPELTGVPSHHLHAVFTLNRAAPRCCSSTKFIYGVSFQAGSLVRYSFGSASVMDMGEPTAGAVDQTESIHAFGEANTVPKTLQGESKHYRLNCKNTEIK